MPTAKEILNMFEFSREKLNFSVDTYFDESPLSQQRSVPTEQQALSIHWEKIPNDIQRLNSKFDFTEKIRPLFAT